MLSLMWSTKELGKKKSSLSLSGLYQQLEIWRKFFYFNKMERESENGKICFCTSKTKQKRSTMRARLYYIVLGCCYTPCFCFYIRSLINTLIQVPPYKDLKKKERKKLTSNTNPFYSLLHVVQRSLHVYKCDYSISGLFKAEIST